MAAEKNNQLLVNAKINSLTEQIQDMLYRNTVHTRNTTINVWKLEIRLFTYRENYRVTQSVHVKHR